MNKGYVTSTYRTTKDKYSYGGNNISTTNKESCIHTGDSYRPSNTHSNYCLYNSNCDAMTGCCWKGYRQPTCQCDCYKEPICCDCCCEKENHCKHKIEDNTGLTGLEIELEGDAQVVESKKQVIFNKQVTRYTPDLALVENGSIIITKTGIYKIEWWVTTESIQMGQDTYVAFGVEVNGVTSVIGMNANAYGQVCGTGIIHIFASSCVPAYLRLINITDGQIAFGQAPIKSHLVISYTKE